MVDRSVMIASLYSRLQGDDYVHYFVVRNKRAILDQAQSYFKHITIRTKRRSEQDDKTTFRENFEIAITACPNSFWFFESDFGFRSHTRLGSATRTFAILHGD